MLDSEERFTKKKQLLVFISYLIPVLSMGLFLPFKGVVINEKTNWNPVLSFPFFLYIIIVLSFGAIVPLFYTSFKILKKIQDETLRKKWKISVIGFAGCISYMYGIYVVDYLRISSLEIYFNLYGLSIVIWLSLVYYGVIRQLDPSIEIRNH